MLDRCGIVDPLPAGGMTERVKGPIMKKAVTWVLVADGARARILSTTGWGAGLTAVGDQIEGDRRPSRDQGTERPGRVHDRSGPGRHAMEPKVDWHEFEKQQFAKQMAGHLNRSAQRKAFDRLVLVAPPKALGDLRAALDKHTANLVLAELAKDLTRVSERDLARHLENIMPV